MLQIFVVLILNILELEIWKWIFYLGFGFDEELIYLVEALSIIFYQINTNMEVIVLDDIP